MFRKFVVVAALFVFSFDSVLATGVSLSSSDAAVQTLIQRLQSIKSSLFSQLDTTVSQTAKSFESHYSVIENNLDYRNLLCMGVVSLGTDAAWIKQWADLLRSKILRTYNTILGDIQYNQDSYANGLLSEQNYSLALNASNADVNDFQANFSQFVTDFYSDQLAILSGKTAYMDQYLKDNKSLMATLSDRRMYLDDLIQKNAGLQNKKTAYLQYFWTVLGLDDVYDSLLTKIRDDVAVYFEAKRKSYLQKHSWFLDLESQLKDQENSLYDTVEVELRRYMDNMLRYYDGDQYDVLDQYMTTINGLYYGASGAVLCNNIVGYRDVPMMTTVWALIDDMNKSLDQGYTFFKITSGSVSNEDFFGEKLNEKYAAIVKSVTTLYDQQTTALIDTLVTKRKEQRNAFRDLLRMKAMDFDKAQGSARDAVRRDLVSKARALLAQVVAKQLLYDVNFVLYALWEPVFLDAFDNPRWVTMTPSDYLGSLYDDYLSDEWIRSTSVLVSSSLPVSKYSVEQIQAKLMLLKDNASDKDLFDQTLLSAIDKATELLRSDAVSLNQKVLIHVVKQAMKRVVSLN